MKNVLVCVLTMLLFVSCSNQDQEALKELIKALILVGTLTGVLPAILVILLIYGIKALCKVKVSESKPYDPQKAKHRKWEALMDIPEEDRNPDLK